MAWMPTARWQHLVVIVGVAALLTLPALGSTSFWDIDEGLNAEAAREMHESGDFVMPYFNFKPRTAKPPLLYWLQASCYRAFGVNEFAARLPSALAMTLAALLTYRLGRRMFTPKIGCLAALVLLSSVQTSVLAHAATPDAVLLLCLLLTFSLFWDGYAAGGGRWLWTTGIGCGLAALAKGPVGVALPVATVSYFLLAQKQLRQLIDIRILGGAALAIVIAGPWYALVGAETHGAFLRAFWQNDNVGRFMTAMEGHRGPFWYYLVTVTLGLVPWCVFLLPTATDSIAAISNIGDSGVGETPNADVRRSRIDRAAIRFLISWLAVYLGFFSLAQTKLPNYAFPVFPPVALLISRYLIRWSEGRSFAPKWSMRLAIGLLGAIGVAAFVGVLIAGGALFSRATHGRAIVGLAPWAALGLIPIAGAALAWLMLHRGRRLGVIGTVVATAVVFLWSLEYGPVHVIDRQKAPKPLVAQSGSCQQDVEVRTASFCYFQPSLVFYCGREVSELATEQDALDFLRGPFPSYLFCPADVAQALLAQMPTLSVLSRQRDFYKGWDVVVLRNGAEANSAVAQRANDR